MCLGIYTSKDQCVMYTRQCLGHFCEMGLFFVCVWGLGRQCCFVAVCTVVFPNLFLHFKFIGERTHPNYPHFIFMEGAGIKDLSKDFVWLVLPTSMNWRTGCFSFRARSQVTVNHCFTISTFHLNLHFHHSFPAPYVQVKMRLKTFPMLLKTLVNIKSFSSIHCVCEGKTLISMWIVATSF